MQKILITGSPKAGKSQLAKKISMSTGAEHYCTDPFRMCDQGAHGTPDSLEWSETSQFIADNWIGKKQLVEGVAVPRALRKWRKANPNADVPFDKLIVLEGTFEELSKGQEAMYKGTIKVLNEVIESWPELADKIEFVDLTK